MSHHRRARDLGIEFDGRTGPANAITDVPGVRVGHETLIAGESTRTGVTVVFPRSGDDLVVPVLAGVSSFNGFGEMTAFSFIREVGRFAGPIALTSSNSVGTVHAGVLKWMVRRFGESGLADWAIPVVAETWDGWLHDIDSFAVTEEHVAAALDCAGADAVADNAVAEGGIGGGTGMMSYGHKGGIGTASRQVTSGDHACTVGVLLQANFGRGEELVVRGKPLGRQWAKPQQPREGDGSVIVIVATDAPLLPYQLARVARRATVGIARTGTCGRTGSGDIFLAFSTAHADTMQKLEQSAAPLPLSFVPDARINPLFEAVGQATEEAVLNALAAGGSMQGYKGRTVAAFRDSLAANAGADR